MIKMNNVVKTYENGRKALNGISFEIDSGEFAFLVGPSGSGKTSILKLITAETAVTSGELVVNGFDLNTIKPKQIPYVRRTLGVVFQNFRLIDKKNIFENVAFALRATGAGQKEIQKRVPYALELVGLKSRTRSFPQELSGGEQQRVAIARSLVNNPKMIVADEPTGNLDPAKSLDIMELFEEINKLGTTVLVVTHERSLVNSFLKRVIAIDDGKIISDGMGGYYNYETK